MGAWRDGLMLDSGASGGALPFLMPMDGISRQSAGAHGRHARGSRAQAGAGQPGTHLCRPLAYAKSLSPNRLKSSIKIECRSAGAACRSADAACRSAGAATAHRDSVPALESEPTSARQPGGSDDSDGGDAWPTAQTPRRSGCSGGRASTRCSTTCARSRSTRHTARRRTRSSSPRSVAGGSPSCRATAGATRSRRTRSTTGPTSGRCARSGVKAVISPCAAGSLQLAVKPGDFVVCDQFVDRTSGRADTFFDGPIVTHLSSAEIYDPVLRELAIATIRDHGIEVHDGGTVVVIQGPRFSIEVRVEVVQRRRLGGHQHDPVPRGVAVPRARDGGRQHQPDHRLRRRRPRGDRGGQRDERARGLPAERRADPGASCIDLIGRFPADLDALGARAALEPTRGDGHAIAREDIRLFETGL